MTLFKKIQAWLTKSSVEAAVEAMKEFDSNERIDILIASCTAGELSVALRLRQEGMESYKRMIGAWDSYDG